MNQEQVEKLIGHYVNIDPAMAEKYNCNQGFTVEAVFYSEARERWEVKEQGYQVYYPATWGISVNNPFFSGMHWKVEEIPANEFMGFEQVNTKEQATTYAKEECEHIQYKTASATHYIFRIQDSMEGNGMLDVPKFSNMEKSKKVFSKNSCNSEYNMI